MDERAQAVARRESEREADLKEGDRRRQAKDLWEERGDRYRRCTLGNFQVETEAQREVLRQISEYGDRLAEEIAMGTNIVLTGPIGTGKDHLLAALMSLALAGDHTVQWTCGARLFSRRRDGIITNTSEWSLIERYSRPAVFVLSDPITERGALTQDQRNTLYQIVDARYNDCRPIWITINAKDRAEASTLMGSAILDRLRDGALSLACNWGSFRKPLDREETSMKLIPERPKP
jgi:DNA replication protein DnaC